MPANPTRSKVFLPAFSTSTSEITVMKTFIAPTPIVAFWAAFLSSCAIVKIFVEKNITALMPDSCCANMIMMEMNNGMRSAGFINSSRTVTFGINFIDSYSVRISSISSWTSIVPRNQDNAATRRHADEKRRNDENTENSDNRMINDYKLQ